jgi:ATP-dependent DNA ligase
MNPLRWKPMMAVAATTLPKGPEWLYEVKWDGYRTIAIKDRSKEPSSPETRRP